MDATARMISRGENTMSLETGVGGRMGQTEPRGTDQPAQTLTAKADSVLVTPFGVPRYGERDGQEPRTRFLIAGGNHYATEQGAGYDQGYGRQDYGQQPDYGRYGEAPPPTYGGGYAEPISGIQRRIRRMVSPILCFLCLKRFNAILLLRLVRLMCIRNSVLPS